MRADNRFLGQPAEFWAAVRTLSEEVGYTRTLRKTKDRPKSSCILVPTLEEIRAALKKRGLDDTFVVDATNIPTALGKRLLAYFEYRAEVLNYSVRTQLMNCNEAQKVFDDLKRRLHKKCPLPMNKQKGQKKQHAFLTGIVNILLETHLAGDQADYDPRTLTTVVRNQMPLRTFSRRVDGAYPATVNPVAIWEIKEYYYTTTFGSRVADGVYETLLDGMELAELRSSTGIHVEHVLFVDDYFTWWECGRSYLCRMVDMLHMGFVDEVIFGKEVLTRLPDLAREWKAFAATHRE